MQKVHFHSLVGVTSTKMCTEKITSILSLLMSSDENSAAISLIPE